MNYQYIHKKTVFLFLDWNPRNLGGDGYIQAKYWNFTVSWLEMRLKSLNMSNIERVFLLQHRPLFYPPIMPEFSNTWKKEDKKKYSDLIEKYFGEYSPKIVHLITGHLHFNHRMEFPHFSQIIVEAFEIDSFFLIVKVNQSKVSYEFHKASEVKWESIITEVFGIVLFFVLVIIYVIKKEFLNIFQLIVGFIYSYIILASLAAINSGLNSFLFEQGFLMSIWNVDSKIPIVFALYYSILLIFCMNLTDFYFNSSRKYKCVIDAVIMVVFLMGFFYSLFVGESVSFDDSKNRYGVGLLSGSLNFIIIAYITTCWWCYFARLKSKNFCQCNEKLKNRKITKEIELKNFVGQPDSEEVKENQNSVGKSDKEQKTSHYVESQNIEEEIKAEESKDIDQNSVGQSDTKEKKSSHISVENQNIEEIKVEESNDIDQNFDGQSDTKEKKSSHVSEKEITVEESKIVKQNLDNRKTKQILKRLWKGFLSSMKDLLLLLIVGVASLFLSMLNFVVYFLASLIISVIFTSDEITSSSSIYIDHTISRTIIGMFFMFSLIFFIFYVSIFEFAVYKRYRLSFGECNIGHAVFFLLCIFCYIFYTILLFIFIETENWFLLIVNILPISFTVLISSFPLLFKVFLIVKNIKKGKPSIKKTPNG